MTHPDGGLTSDQLAQLDAHANPLLTLAIFAALLAVITLALIARRALRDHARHTDRTQP